MIVRVRECAINLAQRLEKLLLISLDIELLSIALNNFAHSQPHLSCNAYMFFYQREYQYGDQTEDILSMRQLDGVLHYFFKLVILCWL